MTFIKTILMIGLIASCSNEFDSSSPPGGGGPPASNDYLTNIYDEWLGNRGIVPATDAPKGWKGNIFGRNLTVVTGVDYPTNGIMPTGASGAFQWSVSSNPGFTGAFTFAYLIQKSAVGSAEVRLHRNNTVPKVSLDLQISAGNHNIGIYINDILYDTGVEFPYDSDFHTLIFRVDGAGAAASVWLDGSQIGSTFSITGGATNMDSAQNMTVAQGNINIKRMRIYQESLSDENIGILNTGDFNSDAPVDTTPVHMVFVHGQSNVGFNGKTDFPSYIKDAYTGVLEYQIDGTNVFALGDFGGPALPMGYYLRIKYPDDDIRVCITYKFNTGFYTSGSNWGIGGDLRTAMKGHMVNVMHILESEQRTIGSIHWYWIQGEKDAGEDHNPPTGDYAYAYYDNITLLDSEVKAIIGSSAITIISKLTTRFPSIWQPVVTQAEVDFVADDPTHRLLMDTDDTQSEYSMWAGNIHYDVNGNIKQGQYAASVI